MAVAKTLHKDGANITVVISGEVLGLPGGPVDRWTNRFAQAIRANVVGFAPTNKRPRWAHYGTTLKESISVNDPTFRKSKGGFRLHASVGSSAPHAYYVDQGTNDFEAKILPPWGEMGYKLHEHTWKPGWPYVNSEPVGTTHVSGQAAQEFFKKGVKAAYAEMHTSSRAASDTEPQIAAANRVQPYGMDQFKGNTDGANPLFRQELRAWREERDEWWWGRAASMHARRVPGDEATAYYRRFVRKRRRRQARSPEERREVRRLAQKKYRDENRDRLNYKRRKKKAESLRESPETPAEQRRREADARKAVNTARAAQAQARANAISAERAALQEQVSESYGAKGYRATVSGRLKHEGVYQYRIDLVGTKSGKRLTLWVPSSYS